MQVKGIPSCGAFQMFPPRVLEVRHAIPTSLTLVVRISEVMMESMWSTKHFRAKKRASALAAEAEAEADAEHVFKRCCETMLAPGVHKWKVHALRPRVGRNARKL